MDSSADSISSCRHCRHYAPEGRRGGHCDRLDALVHGHWTACHLGVPTFAPSWESLEELVTEPVTLISRGPASSLPANSKPPLVLAKGREATPLAIAVPTLPAPSALSKLA